MLQILFLGFIYNMAKLKQNKKIKRARLELLTSRAQAQHFSLLYKRANLVQLNISKSRARSNLSQTGVQP